LIFISSSRKDMPSVNEFYKKNVNESVCEPRANRLDSKVSLRYICCHVSFWVLLGSRPLVLVARSCGCCVHWTPPFLVDLVYHIFIIWKIIWHKIMFICIKYVYVYCIYFTSINIIPLIFCILFFVFLCSVYGKVNEYKNSKILIFFSTFYRIEC
jgi:hypothetical protein